LSTPTETPRTSPSSSSSSDAEDTGLIGRATEAVSTRVRSLLPDDGDREERDDQPSDSDDDDNKERAGREKSSVSAPIKSSHIISEFIDVGVPRDVAFAQWTEYDAVAQFTKKESARQQRPDRVKYTSKIGPSQRMWNTQIVEQVPPRRVAWRSVGGPRNMGVVTFHALDERLTRVMVEIEYHPGGFFETVGNFFRMQRRRVRKNLKLFKAFIELRGEATGKGATKEVDAGDGLRADVDEQLPDDEDDNAGNGRGKERS